MNELTTLERRGMAAISTPAGHMLIVAADQRNGMKAVMTDAPDGRSITPRRAGRGKSDLVRYLAQPRARDPARPRGRAARGRRRRHPRTRHRAGRRHGRLRFRDGRRPAVHPVRRRRHPAHRRASSAATSRRCSSTCARTGRAPTRGWRDEIRDLVNACEDEGLLLIVELLTYRLEDETEEAYQAAFPQLVADGARLAVACGAKMLKLPYPGFRGGQRGASPRRPRVSRGPCSRRASTTRRSSSRSRSRSPTAPAGAMAGRSLWKDSLSSDPAARGVAHGWRRFPRYGEPSPTWSTADPDRHHPPEVVPRLLGDISGAGDDRVEKVWRGEGTERDDHATTPREPA